MRHESPIQQIIHAMHRLQTRMEAQRVMALRPGRKAWDQVYEMAAIKKGKRMIPRQTPEFAMQCALFNWRDILVPQYPELRLLRGSMNGVKLTKAQAGKAKAAGMLKGEHDTTLPVARGGYIGLSVELKHGKNKPTKDQLDYGEMLTAEGWFVAYCWEWTEAADLIQKYLQGKIIKA